MMALEYVYRFILGVVGNEYVFELALVVRVFDALFPGHELSQLLFVVDGIDVIAYIRQLSFEF